MAEARNDGETRERLFVARQPIFDASRTVQGYEILFRSGFKNSFDPSIDANYASGRALSDTYMTFGIEELTGGRRAFINFTQRHLEDEVPAVFPKDHLVVEVLENVEPTVPLVAAVRNLKEAGHTIALDDFRYHLRFEPLLRLADIIKVDFVVSPPAERASLVRRLRGRGIRFLAEKVETNDEFESARGLGCTLFQGYFFARPQILQSSEIPGSKLNYLEVLREVNAPEMDFAKVEAVVKRDLSLSYKFLRFVNSAYFGFPTEVQSLRQALRILGVRGIRTWLSLVALTGLGGDKPQELVVTALSRALFLERLGVETGRKARSAELFFIGLFSVIDAILDRPMETVLHDLPLSADVKDALTGRPNELRALFEVLEDYEQGNWQHFSSHALAVGLSEHVVPTIYRDVVTEASAVVRHVPH